MTMHDRAAQFGAFKALSGYEDAIAETARLTDNRAALSDEQAFVLNETIKELCGNIAEKPEVELEYFVPDSRKPGGAYVKIRGRLRRFDGTLREFVFSGGEKIPADSVVKITILGKS